MKEAIVTRSPPPDLASWLDGCRGGCAEGWLGVCDLGWPEGWLGVWILG